MPAAKRERRSTYALYAALALLFLISATYRALDVTERVAELRHGTSTSATLSTSICPSGSSRA